ncbi:MAG TPA: putative DNA binding domain-containing protein [Candidatus Competibacteraceae bacterium]|nr:putative DNA binding domain-containing protein [Candidatus Competibacteraceae bacterium]MCP5134249.1 putative DNA binding domain-containing protein [Gammaproteobacteria bacterium]HPF60381.1 putative DNA binding domain-containing protein [Candidatus Competibacteraceae bacterium]HRY19811.1 putative DNA binding domain-containing protein [Candidatus Competibacteraceae bacterium]
MMWFSKTQHRKPDRLGPRKRLLRDLLLLLTLTIGSLLIAVFIAGETLRDRLAQEQLQGLAQKTSEDLTGFLQLPENSLRIAQGWGMAGDLNLDDTPALVNRFIPVLENLTKVSALVLADSEGRSFYLTREEQNWLSRQLDAQGNAVWQRWSRPGMQIQERQGQENYDPRSRPWFKGALEIADANAVFWTRPYLFFTERTAGITGAVRFQKPGEPGRDYVLGLDLPLRDILQALSQLKIGERGAAFIAEANGAVLLPPAVIEASDSTLSASLSPDKLDAGPIFDAAKAWLAAGRPARQPVTFHEGTWWAWLQPLGDPDKGLWLGITIPEWDFLGTLQSSWMLVSSVGVLAFAAGLIATLLLTRHYGRQFKALPSLTGNPAEFEEKVLALIRYGESPNLEFKSTLRTNLKTSQAGKEIELAWLKSVVGFMNTDGGILLIGVNDGGEVVGIAADQFENNDKCLLHFKNLINRHIGAEFSKYLHAEIRPVTGRTVVAVVCEKAREPAFLLAGGNEEFHIRSGPSSIKLTPRQMLQYLSVH